MDFIIKKSQIAINAADARTSRFTGGEKVDCAIAELDFNKRKASLSMKLLEEIEEYNKQDCISTFKLRNWLLKIKPEDTKWYIPEKEHFELRPFEETLLEYQKKFNESKYKDKPTVKLLSDVIGYYKDQKDEIELLKKYSKLITIIISKIIV